MQYIHFIFGLVKTTINFHLISLHLLNIFSYFEKHLVFTNVLILAF